MHHVLLCLLNVQEYQRSTPYSYLSLFPFCCNCQHATIIVKSSYVPLRKMCLAFMCRSPLFLLAFCFWACPFVPILSSLPLHLYPTSKLCICIGETNPSLSSFLLRRLLYEHHCAKDMSIIAQRADTCGFGGRHLASILSAVNPFSGLCQAWHCCLGAVKSLMSSPCRHYTCAGSPCRVLWSNESGVAGGLVYSLNP